MALHNSLDSIFGECLDQVSNFILSAFGLWGIFGPNFIFKISTAVVPDMPNQDHSIGPTLPQFGCLSNHDIFVIQEVVFGE